MTTLIPMTEIPEGEFTEHPAEILHRVASGEDVVVTIDGRPTVDLRRHTPGPRPLTWDEFWTRLEAIPPDPTFADDVRGLVEDTDDSDPRR
jgi:antitoxin (DNA-binding transcriptional repressor) of toxin-antitoxin stability system